MFSCCWGIPSTCFHYFHLSIALTWDGAIAPTLFGCCWGGFHPYINLFSLFPLVYFALSHQLYQENCQEIRSILSEMAMDLPHYHNLEWRLDVQVASRALQRQAHPSVLLRLHTKDGGVCVYVCDVCV